MANLAQRNQKLDFVSTIRQAATDLLDAHNRLKAAQLVWNAMDYGSTLTEEDLMDSTHEGLIPQKVGAAVFATSDALSDLLAQGHATNLASIRN